MVPSIQASASALLADFTPRLCEALVSHASPSYLPVYIDLGVATAFIDVDSQSVEACDHYFAELTRYGHGTCAHCGGRAWSPAWVESGCFKQPMIEGTSDYIVATLFRLRLALLEAGVNVE